MKEFVCVNCYRKVRKGTQKCPDCHRNIFVPRKHMRKWILKIAKERLLENSSRKEYWYEYE